MLFFVVGGVCACARAAAAAASQPSPPPALTQTHPQQNNNNKKGTACYGRTPAYTHDNLGSSVFVFHANAAAEYQAKIVTPFFVKLGGGKFTANQFTGAVAALKEKKLNGSLQKLGSAKVVNLFSVAVNTEEQLF